MTTFDPGEIVSVSGTGDLGMDANARKFIQQECTILKVCKSGLYLVSLNSDPTKTHSLPKRNLVKM